MDEYHRPRRSPRRRIWLGAAIVALIVLALVLIQGVRVGIELSRAYQQAQQFAGFMQGDLSPERYELAQTMLRESADSIVQAEANFAPFTPVLQRLKWLPWLGEDLAALPILFRAGRDLVTMGVTGFDLAKPVLLATPGSSPLARLPLALQQSETQLAEISATAAIIDTNLQGIQSQRLSSLLREPVDQLQAAVKIIAPSLRLSHYLPEILGVGQTRTYLVLAQNNHELRGTGGFVTAVGRVTLADGRIVGMEFMDSYDPSINRTDLPLPQAPLPMQKYMGIDIMLLRDVNWSPDFPTTAQIARTIYSQQTGRTVDGIFTIDLQAVEQVVTALEPLQLAGIAEPMTGATVVERIREFWAAPPESTATLASGDPTWWQQRKDFIPKLAEGAVARIQQGNFDYLRMLSALQTSLTSRALQLWFTDGVLARELALLDWDGGLHPTREGDFLALVDTNFGYNKVNAIIEQSVNYTVAWPADGAGSEAARGLATLEIQYRHPVARDGYICDQTPHYDGSYEEMMVRCYFDYLRIYAPVGSELIGTEGLQPESVTSQRGEGGAQLFSGYFILAPGKATTVRLPYHLPATITPENYALVVRRQSGTRALPVVAQVANEMLNTTISAGTLQWKPGHGTTVIAETQP